MIEKARRAAEEYQIPADFQVGDIENVRIRVFIEHLFDL